MLYDSTSNPVVEYLGHQLSRDTCEARRQKARIIESVHNGSGTYQLVLEKLRARYDTGKFKALQLDHGIATWNKIMQDILAKVNIEWDGGSVQKLDGPGGAKLADDEALRFANFIRVAQYDHLVMKPVSRWCWVHPAICVLPVVTWSPNIGMRKFHHILLTPEHFDLEVNPEDHTDWIALHVYGTRPPEKKGRPPIKTKTSWSSEEVVEYDLDEQSGEWKARGKPQPNPYGCVPAVIFYGDPSATGVWGHDFGEMLTDLSIEINAAETWLSFMQSLQIKVPMGQFKQFPTGQIYSHGQPVSMGDAESILEVDLQTDIARFREVYIRDPRRQAAITMGLNADEFEITGTPPSGEALKMRKHSVEQMAAARRRPLSEALKQLYWMGQRVLYFQMGFAETKGEHAGKVVPIQGFGDWPKQGDFVPPAPESVLPPYDDTVHYWTQQPFTFHVDVQETVYPELAVERETRQASARAAGFANRVEQFKEVNPDTDLDDKAIRAKIMDNLRMEAEFLKMSQPVKAPVDLMKARFGPNG